MYTIIQIYIYKYVYNWNIVFLKKLQLYYVDIEKMFGHGGYFSNSPFLFVSFSKF